MLRQAQREVLGRKTDPIHFLSAIKGGEEGTAKDERGLVSCPRNSSPNFWDKQATRINSLCPAATRNFIRRISESGHLPILSPGRGRSRFHRGRSRRSALYRVPSVRARPPWAAAGGRRERYSPDCSAPNRYPRRRPNCSRREKRRREIHDCGRHGARPQNQPLRNPGG